MNKPARIVLIAAALCVALLAAGYWWSRSRERTAVAIAPETQPAPPAQRRILYWYDPMVPDQHFDRPGKSPFMDMELVPRYADEIGAGGVAIAPDLRQNLGMRTVVVKRGRLDAVLRVPGTIAWDLRQERIVSARVDAVVDRLYIRAPFEPVRAGQPLASVIAPAWSTALAEAQALDKARSAPARALRAAARARLRALGLPAGAVPGRDGRVTLTSPVAGVVSEIGVREGQSAPAGTLLFRVNGNRTVWLDAAIPQAGIAGIAAGTPVEAVVDAWPGTVFRGRVDALLPLVDPDSRAQRARIVLDNPDGVLAPGMFAQVTLRPIAGAEHPLVPSDALIGGGAQTRVIVLGDDDRFRPVLVRPGRTSGGKTEILAGLEGGERIVASGQFLIDSEASLSGALQRVAAGSGESSGGNGEAAAPGANMPADTNLHRHDPPRPDPPQPDEHGTGTPPPHAPRSGASGSQIQPSDRPESGAHQPARQSDAHLSNTHMHQVHPSPPAAPSADGGAPALPEPRS